MPSHTRVPIARLALLDANGRMLPEVEEWLRDGANTIRRYVELPTLLHDSRPDIVIVARALLRDSILPLRKLRCRWPTVIIVVVDALDEADAMRLVVAGADDAVVTGSSTLHTRLRAVARRARTVNAGRRIAVGDVLYDREAHRVWCAGEEVQLTPTEHSLLDCFFWHSPDVIDAATLSGFVWGDDAAPEQRRLLRVYVGYLRRKLRDSRKAQIRTVRGVGYQFAEE